MQEIQLWSIERAGDRVSATPVESVESTATEKLLEDLLVSSPDLLERGMNLIGRQVPCAGGALDLLGIDRDGRVTVFELKRGALTRDAVAQVLDYASELADMGSEGFARLVEESSGRLEIPKIDDFLDWYAQEYPNAQDALAEQPRMVLVGLGADERARRIVSFLATAGVELRLLTFHGFGDGGRTLLARQVEIESAARPLGGGPAALSKEGNREILHAKAKDVGLLDFLEAVRDFLQTRLQAYCWPGKTAYSFSLPERTEQGRPTLRAYLTVYVGAGGPHLLLVFASRALAAAGEEATAALCRELPDAVRDRNSYSALDIRLRPDGWSKIAAALDPFLAAVDRAWRQTAEAEPGEV